MPGFTNLILLLGSRGSKITQPLSIAGIQYHSYNIEGSIKDILKVIYKLITILVKTKTITISDYPGIFALVVLSLSRLTNNRFILRLRGDVWKELEYNHNSISRIFRNIIIGYLMRYSDKIVPVSHHLASIVSAKNCTDEKKLFKIPIPVDCPSFVANVSSPKKDPFKGIDKIFKIITLTNFKFKGKVDGLLEFLPIFDNLVFDKKISLRWVIAGNGKFINRFTNEFKRFPNLKKYIQMKNFVNDKENLLNDADVVLYFSREDGMPNVPLEAMCMQKVVVVNDYEPLREIVIHEINGIVVDTDDVNHASNVIKNILLDRVKRNKIGKQAKRLVEDKYNEFHVGKQFVDILRAVGWDG